MDVNAARGRNLYNSYLLIFLTGFLFSLLTQLQIFFLTGVYHGRALWAFCTGQSENVILAVVNVALFALCRKWRWTRLLLATWLVANLLFLVANQLFYAAFFQPLQLAAADVEGIHLNRLLDSFTSRLDSVFYANLLLALALAALLYWQLVPQQLTHRRPSWVSHLARHRIAYSMAFLAIVLAGILPLTPSQDAAHHPLFVFAASLVRSANPSPTVAEANPSLDIKSLRYGRSAADAETEAPLLAYFQRRQAQHRRPNILYVVLESVGSENLLPHGSLDPSLTPNLARYAPQSILFPVLDAFVPGTEHAHLAISTGGVIYTGQGRALATKRQYTGATLVGEMKGLGYATALFSAAFMDSENFLAIYRHLPFDHAFVPDDQSESYLRAHLLNSWGIDEQEVYRRARQWLDTQPETQPFFLLFLTSNTHHPYSIPAGVPRPFAGKDDLSYYNNALHFADQLIGEIVAGLQETGRLENTLLVISGDHGEAFGLQHPTNFFHRNYLYEENIKNFLLILDFKERGGPILSQKRGEIGDVMPTLLALAGQDAGNAEGQNLFSPQYQETIHYFMTTIDPQKWGLRDGEWKFIAYQRDRAGQAESGPELYNLAQDPTEQNNLAPLLPTQVALYQQLIAAWYVRADQLFISHLASE